MATPRKFEKRSAPTKIDVKSKATKRRSVYAALPPAQAISSTNPAKTADGFTKRPELRRHAEKLLPATQDDVATMPVKDIQRLVHELQAHQIELDTQNQELRGTQLELEAARDRYMELYDFAPAAHLTLDAHGVILEANSRAGTVLGINRKELIGQQLIRFFALEDQDLFHRHCREVLKTGTRQSCEGRLRDKAGGTSWVQLESLAIHNGQEQITHWRTALLPIGERKRAEQELMTQQARLKGIIASAMDAIITVDEEERIVVFNRSAESMFLCKAADAIGQPLDRFIPKRFRHAHHDHVRAFALTRTTSRSMGRPGELYGLRANGEEFPIEASISHAKVIDKTFLTVILRDVAERKQLQQEQDRLIQDLIRSQQHFQTLFNWTPSAVGISTVAEGRFIDVNEALSRLTGYKREEMIGRTSIELGLWDDPSERATMLRDIQEQGRLHNREGRLRTKSGETRSLMVYLDLIQFETVPCLIYLAHDITERKRTEKALRLAKFSVERAADAVYWVDSQAKILDVNEAASRMLGYSRDELRAMTVHDLNPDFQADMWPGFWEETQRRGTMVMETAHRAKDGRLIPIEVSVNFLIHEGKEYHCAFVRDVTERKRAEEERKKQELLISLMLSTGPGCIKRVAADGTLLQMNPAGLKLIEAGREDEAIGLCVFDLVVPEHRTAFVDMHHNVLAGRSRTIQFEIQGLKGTRRWMESHAAPFRNPVSGETEHLAVTHDITESKRAEDRLRDTLDRVRKLSRRMESVREEERTRIARELHDELGVRLTCLKLDLARLQSLTRESIFPRNAMEEKIGSMTAEVDATIAEVQRLVVELRPGILDDLGLVAAMEWQCQDFERRSGIRCLFEASQEQIDLDRAQATAAFRICQEALTNVARHAKATFVRVLVAQRNGALLLEVQDDGEGIPSEKPAEAFSFGVLGIQERASSLGGQAEIAGWPGKGTTVTVRLPMA